MEAYTVKSLLKEMDESQPMIGFGKLIPLLDDPTNTEMWQTMADSLFDNSITDLVGV
jgi:hypothetical protein